MDVMGRVFLAGGAEVKIVTGIDDHSRFVVCAKAVLRATARPVCQALAGALARHGIPEQILTDNGKVFTGRFGPGPGPVLFDRICADNGIKHLLTKPYSPTTTGKVERLHKTMRAEFFTAADGQLRHAGGAAGCPGCVGRGVQHRPAAPVLRRPPADRAVPARDRSIATDDIPAAEPVPAARRRPPRGGQAPGGGVAVGERARQDLPGRVHLRGRASYAGEPVEVVVAGGLVDILHAGVVVATHAQRMREDQADRAPRARVSRRARDATAGLRLGPRKRDFR